MGPTAEPRSPPSNVVLAAVAKATAGDWREFAALADPRSVREWRDRYVEARVHVPTVEEFARDVEGGSDELDRHQLAALVRLHERQYVAPRREFEVRLARQGFGGARTVAEFVALAPADLLAAYLTSIDLVARHRRLAADAYADSRSPVPAEYTDARPTRRFMVVGETRAGRGEVDVTAREGHPVDDAFRARREADAAFRERYPMHGDVWLGTALTWRARVSDAGTWGVVIDDDVLADLRNDMRGREVVFVVDDPVVSRFALGAPPR